MKIFQFDRDNDAIASVRKMLRKTVANMPPEYGVSVFLTDRSEYRFEVKDGKIEERRNDIRSETVPHPARSRIPADAYPCVVL